MYEPKSIEIESFGACDSLGSLVPTNQTRYIRRYLRDLGARKVIVEPYYFDRDYLAEFSAFYGTSARGYPNVCRRLHFFSDDEVTRDMLSFALRGERSAREKLQSTYLGFIVLRPIEAAPLGRTVLRHYPDRTPEIPRITTPEREYHVHIAGFRLTIWGLAWQQQDSAVGACATIALWTMLHSSAFHEHHAAPTTAEITRSAHRAGSLGIRLFPSEGLTPAQICEAIKARDLTPILMPEDVQVPDGGRFRSGISPRRFASSCAALLRSGYPVIIIGRLQDHTSIQDRQIDEPLHAVCAVGFRSGDPIQVEAGEVDEGSGIPYLYIHDDNLGPGVRYRIGVDPTAEGLTLLVPEPPPDEALSSDENPTRGHPPLSPTALIVGVPNELRISVDFLHKKGTEIAQLISTNLYENAKLQGREVVGISFGVRFIKLRDYLGVELERVVPRELLDIVRLSLVEQVQPMGLHLGVIRLAYEQTPLLDVLFDTTDSVANPLPFAHISFDSIADWLVHAIFGEHTSHRMSGCCVKAYVDTVA